MGKIAHDEVKCKVLRAIKHSKFAHFKLGLLAVVAHCALFSGVCIKDFASKSRDKFVTVACALDHGKLRENPHCSVPNFEIHPLQHFDGTKESANDHKQHILGLMGIFPTNNKQQPHKVLDQPSVAALPASKGTPSAVNLFKLLQDIQQKLNALDGTKHTCVKCDEAAAACEAEHCILGDIQEEEEEEESAEKEEADDNVVPPPAQHCCMIQLGVPVQLSNKEWKVKWAKSGVLFAMCFLFAMGH